MSEERSELVKVLFVDDEPNILSSLKRGLVEEPFVKLFANTGEEALRIMEENDVNVIVSDMKMPVMNGLELLKIVSEKYPDVVKIILSGYNQLPQVLATINAIDVYKYIAKPWDMDSDFIPVLNQAIEQYRMRKAYRDINVLLEKKNEFYQKLIKVNDERFMKLKYESLETGMYAVESVRALNVLIHQLMLEKSTVDEMENITKRFNRIYTSYFELVPTEGLTYSVWKTLSNVEGIVKTWQELLTSKFQGHLKTPVIKLGDLENQTLMSIWAPKHFERYMKLILFELALMNVNENEEPQCEVVGFYQADVGRMVLDVSIQELRDPSAKLLRDQFVRCYGKVFELYGGECVNYTKIGKEHFIVTLPVSE